jgi:hypothetical protein
LLVAFYANKGRFMGKLLIAIGGCIFLVGVVITFAPNALSWFGNLPGDIRYQSENSSVFIPITSMVILSLLLNFVLFLLRRL